MPEQMDEQMSGSPERNRCGNGRMRCGEDAHGAKENDTKAYCGMQRQGLSERD